MTKPNIYIALIPICAILISPTVTYAIACLSFEVCTQDIPSGYCCCPTGRTGTAIECPSGWSTGLIGSTCKRDSTTGTDTKGTYTQEYGTCSGTSTKIPCYMTYSMDASNVTDECFCQI